MISRALAWLQSGLERQISFVPSSALIIDYWSKAHLSCHWGPGDAMGTFTFLPQLAFDEDREREREREVASLPNDSERSHQLCPK